MARQMELLFVIVTICRRKKTNFLLMSTMWQWCNCFSKIISNSNTSFAFVTERLNAKIYKEVFNQHFLNSKMLKVSYLKFQYYNAVSHTAKSFWEWLLQNGITIMHGLPCLADSNLLENMLTLINTKIYAHWQQFNNMM